MNGPPGQGFVILVSLGLPLLGLGSLTVWAVVVDRLRRGEPVVPYEPRRQVPWQGLHLLLVVLIYLTLVGLSGVLRSGRAATTQGDSQSGATATVPSVEPAEPRREHPLLIALEENRTPTRVAIAVLLVVVVAPVTEEIFFRLLLQGWLEKVESSWRRRIPGLRKLIPGLLPVLGIALVFAMLHFRTARKGVDRDALFWALTIQGAVSLGTAVLAVWLVRRTAGATANDLGWAPERLCADVRLGLLAFLAIGLPVYLIQLLMNLVVPSKVAADPVALFFFTLVLGLLYFRTHRIVPSVVLHVALNGTSLAMFLVYRAGQGGG
jgi:membrane protease YdiL (CAAX protease family)